MAFFSKLLTRMRPEGTGDADEHTADLRDAFGLRLRSVLATSGIQAEYDPEAFALRLSSGAISWLGNRFEEWIRADPADRDALLLQVASGIFEAAEPSPVSAVPAEARRKLRPRVRQRAHLVIEEMLLEADGMRPDAPFVPLTDDLGVEVVFDTPSSIVSFPTAHLDEWGLTVDEALAVAVENLRRADPSPFDYVGDGTWQAAAGDCYDSARLLLIDRIRRLRVRGEPVALPANRDTLLITGSEHLGGLYRLLQAALAALDHPRLDTLQPVVLRDGAWVDWLPDPDHPMREAFYELAVRTRGTSYAELKELLEADDRQVASFGMLRPSAGSLPFSHAVWHPTPGLLPEADLVSVVHPDEPRYVVVPRHRVVQIVGHLMDPVPGLHPPYCAVSGGPDLGQWEQLRAHMLFEGELGGPR